MCAGQPRPAGGSTAPREPEPLSRRRPWRREPLRRGIERRHGRFLQQSGPVQSQGAQPASRSGQKRDGGSLRWHNPVSVARPTPVQGTRACTRLFPAGRTSVTTATRRAGGRSGSERCPSRTAGGARADPHRPCIRTPADRSLKGDARRPVAALSGLRSQTRLPATVGHDGQTQQPQPFRLVPWRIT
jgi:hypothetical protein